MSVTEHLVSWVCRRREPLQVLFEAHPEWRPFQQPQAPLEDAVEDARFRKPGAPETYKYPKQ